MMLTRTTLVLSLATFVLAVPVAQPEEDGLLPVAAAALAVLVGRIGELLGSGFREFSPENCQWDLHYMMVWFIW
ncbi:hypothetical protein EDB85DRAFT_1951191 [Lactarius pseudohatsudake]|nr:hypothetical protein EDB85DRAFT_1951191 [Lactarius pseudohatsudake]